MRTFQRLTKAYENARVEYFDESSKYVFFSDCHRGDGSLSDEFTKNENTYLSALKYYYESGFTYVELGDGDELWEHSDFKHIKNAHSDVFSLLAKFFHQDRFILIYGNHNAFLKNPRYVEENYYINYDEYTEEFNDFLKGIQPEEAIVLRHSSTGQEILAVHGHQGDVPNDQLWRLTMLSIKYFWRFLHAFGIKNPASPVKNIHKRHKIEKNYSKWIKEKKKMLICGHTHRFKYPKTRDLPYFNTGCCIYPTIITAIEIVGGNIQLVRWEVRANSDGLLKVRRDIMRGPDPVGKFDI
ncbi:calcineurin-like phosphoesterase superfamily domain protein [Andreesenia angusta]|uniref:Calcineurin-like phosphoesterase superfamily domain protein n=1 Tax=Andreesenia angusta TaxID=39480 RepID=A0A1S1VAA5_9FIRM|nr:metallophosphoesterase [Andreesenia angusta]OHW63350.1 calcineurin-like phosphoesterase superfamily domain protein [Andreesenia angusta]